MNPTQIDFLPATYSQNRLRFQKKLWHRGVAVVFLVCIVLGTVQQQRLRMLLVSKRDLVQQQAQQTVKQLGDPTALQQEIQRLDARANLVAFLRLRTPPTRILATVENHLPSYVTLTEISCRQEQARDPFSNRNRSTPTPQKPDKSSKPGAVEDLERLRSERKRLAQSVLVSGIAPNDGALAEFLSGLQSDGLFQDVELVFSEEHRMQDEFVRRFQVRLVLRDWTLKTSPAATPSTASDLREGRAS